MFEYAESIANGDFDKRYGVYALLNVSGDFNAIMHVNFASLPGTSGKTLRLNWVLVAPRFEFDDQEAVEISNLFSEILDGAVELSKHDPAASHIKICLGNVFDRTYFAMVAQLLGKYGSFSDVRIRGNWFHLSK